jgi:hypothetical protein
MTYLEIFLILFSIWLIYSNFKLWAQIEKSNENTTLIVREIAILKVQND